jgi:hypothetical protein
MSEATRHLAQLNVGRMVARQGDPRVEEFFANLDRINAIAERMPGFVWRLKDESGNATNLRPFDDPNLLLNMSVWEDIESLEKFVFQTAHTAIYRKKANWFEPMQAPHFVMWWIDAGHIPTPAEAKERLDHLAANGASEFAFDWEAAPQAKLWREKRCA